MIRPATKIALEVVAGVVAVAMLLVAAAAWRLSQGPLPVSFLTPFVTQAANDQLPGYRVSISDMVIAWVDSTGTLELQAVDVAIVGEEDREVVAVPAITVDFSPRAALAGRLVPRKLVFAGASLTLVRSMDGTMRFGLTNVPDDALQPLPAPEPQVSEEGDALISTLIEAVSTPGDGSGSGRHLEGLSISDASITVFDQRSGGLWLASGVGLEFRNTPLGLAGVINAHVLSPGGEWDLIGTVRATGPDQPIVVVGNVNTLKLPDFARTMPVLQPLAMLDSQVSGRVTAELNRDGLSIAGLSLDLTAGPGTLTLPIDQPAPFYPPKPLGFDGKPQPEDPHPPYSPQPWVYAIDSAHIKGNVTWPEGAIELDEIAIKGDAIDLSLSGSGKAIRQPGGGIEEVEVSFKSGPLALNVPHVTVGIARVDGLEAAMRYAPDAGRLQIEKTAVTLGEGYVSLTGDIGGLAGGDLTLAVDGKLEKILLTDLMQVWPPRVGHGAREWVEANISTGILDNGRIRIDAENGELGQTPLPDEAVDMSIDFADVTARYLGELPPISDGRGTLLLTGNSFTAQMTGGQIEPSNGGLIQISKGSFKTDNFQIRGNNAFIEVNAAGSMTAILSLLDKEPLGYASRFGIDPRDVSGTGTTRITVTLPMRNQLRFADIVFGASGHTGGLVLPDLADGISMAGGEMDFDINNDRLRAKGTIEMAATPVGLSWIEDFDPGGKPGSTFEIAGTLDNAARERLGFYVGRNLDGALPLTATLKGRGPDITSASFVLDLGPVTVSEPLIGWKKEAGIPATMSGAYERLRDGGTQINAVNLTGEGVQLQGDMAFDADGALQRASISRLMLGNGTQLTGVAQRSPNDGILYVDVEGPLFDARDFLDGLFEDTPAPDEDKEKSVGQKIIANAKVARVLGHSGEALENVSAYLLIENTRMQQLSLDGVFTSGGMLTIEMKPTTYGTRSIEAQSQNAGSVLRAIDIYSNVEGGTVELQAEIDDRIDGSPLEGRLTGTDLRVRNAPVLASILTVGSLTGISDTLQGEGILFTKLDAPVRINDRAIDLKDAILSGPAIGATVKGHVDRETDEIDLGGTIVPAYTVNSFLGNIPVLGDLLVGREGEGLFGMTYRISGKSDDPEVTVNPLAAFAPGILRRIFEMGGRASEDMPASAPAPADNTRADDAPAAPAPGGGG